MKKIQALIFALAAASFFIAGCSTSGCVDPNCSKQSTAKVKKTRAPVVHKYSK